MTSTYSLSSQFSKMLSLIMFGLVAISCGKEPIEGSNLNYTVLQKSAFLATLQDNDTLSICGSFASKAEKAVETWLAAVGREKTIKYEESCSGSKVLNMKIGTKAELCAIYNLPSNCAVEGSAGGDTVTVRKETTFNIILHEIGHVFGLNHSQDSQAVMAAFANGEETLQQDDIDGIRALVPSRKSSSTSNKNSTASNSTNKISTTSTTATTSSTIASVSGGNNKSDICKNNSKINNSLSVVYDESCSTSGGSGCIEDLPCRYEY